MGADRHESERKPQVEPAFDAAGPVASDSGAAGALLGLQRSAGNRSVVALLGAVQRKVVVGAADDPLEVEADRIARRTVDFLRGRDDEGVDVGDDRLTLRRSSAATAPVPAAGGEAGADVERALATARGAGRAIDVGLRRDMETAMGADFSDVRLHDGPRATQLNEQLQAKAFTYGRDIFFRQPPDLSGAGGQELLAHELAHTVQQGAARRSVATGDATPVHRKLFTPEEFKKNSNAGLFAGRGKTIKELDKLLTEYHSYRSSARHLKLGSDMDRCLAILQLIKEDIEFWRKSHTGDTSRSAKREPALDQLYDQANAERAEILLVRDAAKTQGGFDVKPLSPVNNTFTAKMSGDASSVLEKLAPAVSSLIPNPGDSASLEISCEFPCEPTGVAYVGARLKISADRSDRTSTKLGLEVAALAGAKLTVGAAKLDVGGEIGCLLEAHGKTPKEAMKLLSYGWYETLRNSALPRETVNILWGGSATAVGWNRAEQWAANVEQEAFGTGAPDDDLSSGVGSDRTTNAYVRSAAFLGGSATAELKGGVELGGEARATYGRHYDKKSVSDRKEEAGSKLGEALPQPSRGTNVKLGDQFLQIDLSFSASGGIVSGGLDLSLECMQESILDKAGQPTGKTKFRPTYISVSGNVGAKFGLEDPAIALVGAVQTIAKKISDNSGKVATKAQAAADTKADKAAAAKDVQDAGKAAEATAKSSAAKLRQELKAKLPGQMKAKAANAKPPTAAQIFGVANRSLNIAAGYDFQKKVWTFDVSIQTEVEVELDLEVVGLTYTKSERLLRFIFDTSGTVIFD